MRFAEQWSWCTVDAIRDVTPGIREFRLRPDGGVAPYPAGSHLNVAVLIDGQPARRSYSLVGDRDPEVYRIAVRLAPDSRGGSRAMWSLKPGARIEISNPTSLLDIDWNRKNYCLIAGGIGITPISGIASALHRRNIDLRLHYAVKSRGDAAYLDELSSVLDDRLVVHASDEGERLDLDATFRALPSDAMAIMCGPMRMLEAARRAWNEAGRAPADLRYETFGSSGLLPTAEFRVRLKDTGAELVVSPNSSMLDVLNDAGFEVISDCQRGECGVCAVDVIAVDGEIDHRDVFFSDAQKQGNRKICPCVSRAVGVVTIDTLYRAEAPLRG
ncbi:oxidoreductase [Bradyrhizobium sp. AUGA SZCCT0240]|uniref:PDR/VanB family oxidoreductase n=1 Tax=unclassified Bradyrhizobium TaxID=2631580 RepID=UPI001BA5C322|nr:MULTISPECIES: PDR/VanB family oxidoreductase [unclassified Bradyrhizobium]MBR1198641.1 oxidoreductase [Bradyrhizobium sp. AUGA SZCCT0158]MBR1239554.1 oxidoreductase [Bradyrhizobium sp. AUGA SZCCT0274]MBR1255509.1 oxidoreductase [Bradyrhizobium sp. AUGA SZCCT0240]